MKCDLCEREATVHEVTVRNGVKIERHLCEVCAEQHGIAQQQPNAVINDLLKQFMTQGITPSVTITPVGRVGVCPTCRTTFVEFKQSGLVGCADCYTAFESQLLPLLERAQEGGVHHTGKVPKRLCKAQQTQVQSPAIEIADRVRRVREVRERLESAVAQEKYELAAKLRDELRRIESEGNETRTGQ